MTKENKELLLKDLCARLPYGVLCKLKNEILPLKDVFIEGVVGNKGQLGFGINKYGRIFQEIDEVKPYLRPMKTMTEKDVQEIRDRLNNLSIGRTITEKNFEKCCDFLWFTKMSIFECVSEKMMEVVIGYLDENMFDHRGLIPKGLALEATEGMYKI